MTKISHQHLDRPRRPDKAALCRVLDVGVSVTHSLLSDPLGIPAEEIPCVILERRWCVWHFVNIVKMPVYELKLEMMAVVDPEWVCLLLKSSSHLLHIDYRD